MNRANQVAIVTGGASGIGLELGRQLRAQGAQVVLADIDAKRLHAAAGSLGAHARVTDVADPAQVDALVDDTVRRHGRLDLMFNNAGFSVLGEVHELPVQAWRSIVDVNLLGVIWGAQAALRVMRPAGRGQIVNTASLAGLVTTASMSAYGTTKAAVVAFSNALRVEAQAYGIGVTVLCPGFIESSIYENAQAPALSARRTGMRELVKLPVMPTGDAVARMLRAVERNQPIAVFPRYAQAIATLARWLPGVQRPLNRRALADYRAFRGSDSQR